MRSGERLVIGFWFVWFVAMTVGAVLGNRHESSEAAIAVAPPTPCNIAENQAAITMRERMAFADAVAYLRLVRCGCGTPEDHVCRARVPPGDPVDWLSAREEMAALLEVRKRLERRIETGGAE